MTLSHNLVGVEGFALAPGLIAKLMRKGWDFTRSGFNKVVGALRSDDCEGILRLESSNGRVRTITLEYDGTVSVTERRPNV